MQHSDLVQPHGNIGLALFTDGANVYRTASYSATPVFLMNTNLPPSERSKLENMILYALIPPNLLGQLNLILSVLADELVQLSVGVPIYDSAEKKHRTLKAFLLRVITDMVARKEFMQLGGHNSYWGCFTCYVPGEYEINSVEFPTPAFSILRKPSHYFSQHLLELGVGIHGVPAFAHLYKPPTSFDIIWGTVPDPMHNLFMGVTEHIFSRLWFSSSELTAWNINRHLKSIDKIFLGISVPHDWTRKPSTLHEASNWKAEDWKKFALVYSPAILYGYLSPDAYGDWMKFVRAIRLLCAPITKESLEEAEELLELFVALWLGKFGLNIHSLLHVVDYARHHGPIWTWWAFPFEDKNRYLSEVTHATRKPEQQMFTALNLLTSLPFIRNIFHSELHLSERDEEVISRKCFHLKS